jgi:hypothetical protein
LHYNGVFLIMAYDGVGISGNQLQTGGAGTLPIWAAGSGSNISNVNIVVFTSSGTYTPSPGMKQCIVEICGGGGGGAGASTAAPNRIMGAGSGGGSGGYSKKVFTSAQIGASQTVTIGVGGNGSSGYGNGSPGGTTSFGSFLTASGGSGGTPVFTGGGVNYQVANGGGGGVGSGGDINFAGTPGGSCYVQPGNNNTPVAYGGFGGSSIFGGGAQNLYVPPNQASNQSGQSAQNYGSGGGGGVLYISSGSPSVNGGAGFAGICIITEYIA